MPQPHPKPFGYYVVKAIRITGWVLMALMILYILSGYALSGDFGLDRIMGEATANRLHMTWRLDLLLVPAFLVHSAGATYLALRRWGWIKTRRTT